MNKGIHTLRISPFAQKQLKRLPNYIALKLLAWADAVEEEGLEAVRKIRGYHDEPLQGRRWGQRSVRLSRAYRAIYKILHDGTVEFVSIEEVSKHDY